MQALKLAEKLKNVQEPGKEATEALERINESVQLSCEIELGGASTRNLVLVSAHV